MKTGGMKPGAKAVVLVLIIGALYGGIELLTAKGIIPQLGFQLSQSVEKVTLPDVKDALVANVKPVAFPEAGDADIKGPLIKFSIWEWNSQNGLFFANGGARTTKGSLMAKRGVNLQLTRQDDTVKMQEELLACAKEIADGATQCSTGANAVIIMGDGAGAFAAGINPQLKKLGDKYQLSVIASPGYSRGEDAFMAPPEVKRDPKNAKGMLVAGVSRDGDWNILMKWLGDNGIKFNPDERTWDPEAVNWIHSTDYNAAAADYVAKKCEPRKIVKDGKVSSETKEVCITGIVTWTPGDVTAVKERGGLVKVVSSKEYRSQMPSVIIGSRAFFDANKREFTSLVAAMFEGGDQVKAYDAALKKSTEIAAKIYNDQDGAYWYKYHKGVVETDRDGNKVELGGSAVNNLADNKILFGLEPGSNNNFRSTYNTFAKILVSTYPELYKETPIPDVKDLEDKSFILAAEELLKETDSIGSVAEVIDYTTQSAGSVVSAKDYSINFDIGKATLTPSGVAQLNQIKDDTVITGLFIKVTGYTDNTGDETKNVALSKARAQAIKNFLQAKAPKNFPDSRFEVKGLGSSDPVDDNSTEAGRAANRRVSIVLVGGN